MTDFNNLVIENFKDLNKKIDSQNKRFTSIEKALLSVTEYVDKKLEEKKPILHIPRHIWYIVGAAFMGFCAKYGIDVSGFIP